MTIPKFTNWIPFPTKVIENPVTSKVGTVPTLILKNNPERFQFIITNTGQNDIFIGIRSDITEKNSLRVSANGGTFISKYYEDGTFVFREIYAFSTVDNNDIYVLEFVTSEG